MATHPWTQPFLRALAQCGVIGEACRTSGTTSAAVRARRQADPDFEEAFLQALEDSVDLLDHAARSRALHGVQEPVVYQGQLTPVWATNPDGSPVLDIITGNPVQARNPDGSLKWLTITKYSDSLLQFVLTGNRRRLYGHKTEVMGENGGAIQIDEVKKASRIAALLALARDRKDIA